MLGVKGINKIFGPKPNQTHQYYGPPARQAKPKAHEQVYS